MALSKTVNTPSGLTATDAYHRIEGVAVSKTAIQFSVASYAYTDKPAFTSRTYACPYDLSGVNPIKHGYLYLKSLPEWADAVDC